MEQKHTPEPDAATVYDNEGLTLKRKIELRVWNTHAVFRAEDKAVAERFSACWNALAGISDPLSAMAAIKKAITSASSELLAELEDDPEASLLRAALVDLNAAAEELGMEPETLPADPEDGDEDECRICGKDPEEGSAFCAACNAEELCDCDDRSWRGPKHDSACPLAGQERKV